MRIAIKIIIGLWIIFRVFLADVHAEERWIFLTLKKTPIVNKSGKQVEKPVFFSKNSRRLTTGGEWIVPEDIKSAKYTERYQRNKNLLILVDVPLDVKLPPEVAIVKKTEAENLKVNLFGIKPIPLESGVTN